MALDNGTSSSSSIVSEIDLVGGPFSVVESDPGVFTTLIRKLGIRGIEVDEIYDIQPWGLDPLKPKGLILCFNTKHDKCHQQDFLDPAAEKVWFANQLIDDACASLAILNVLFNCLDVELGEELQTFKKETEEMNPKMRGLAISNSRLLRETQNSLARPADMWSSLSATAEATRDLYASLEKREKKKAKMDRANQSVKRRKHLTLSSRKKKASPETQADTFHFIGYVPAHGKVWELDGLKSGPLEVGELPSLESTEGWEDVVRPALRLKMQKYGASGGEGNIQFSLLALVQDRYEVKSDRLELLKRERVALEKRLNEDYGDSWRETVDQDLLSSSEDVFSTLAHPSALGKVFAKDFGVHWNDRKKEILDMRLNDLEETWEDCVRIAMPVKITVDEEVQKALNAQVETAKRIHDYASFIREFLTSLHNEGLLAQYLRSN